MGETLKEINDLRGKTQRDHRQLDKLTVLPLPELPLFAVDCHPQKEPTEMLDFVSIQPTIQSDFLLPGQHDARRQKAARKQPKRATPLYEVPELPLFGPEAPDQATLNGNLSSQLRETSSKTRVVDRDPNKAVPAKIVAPDPHTVTASDLHAAIDDWTDFRLSKRRALHTAINHAETLLTQHRDKLAGFAPWSCGGLNRALWPSGTRAVTLSNDSFRSMLTNLRTIFTRLGLHADSRYAKNELSQAWKAIYDALPTDERRKGLVRFFRFLTLTRVTPDTVTQQALSDFYLWCDTQILHKDAAGLTRRSASNWEDMRKAKQPGWPKVQLKWARMRDQYALPLSQFPKSFNYEIDAFLNDNARLTARGLVITEQGTNVFASLVELFKLNQLQKEQSADQGIHEASGHADIVDRRNTHPSKALKAKSPRSHCRLRTQRTIETRRWQIQVAASALVLSGFPIEKVTSLSMLVCPLDNAMIILDFHRQRMISRLQEQGGEFGPEDVRSSHLKGIGEVLVQIAKYQADLPESDIDELTESIAMVSPFAQFSMTDKNYRRLKALFEEPTYSMLLALPAHWMKLAREPGRDPLNAARLAMYAAALEILLFLPLRRHNLLDLKLDSTLRRPAPGKLINEIYLPAGKVKNRKEIRWPVDPDHAKLLENYITKYRSLLARDGNDFLFPGILEGHRDDAQFGHELSTRVALDIGAEFNCHLVRHFAVVRYLRANPGAYEIAANILGHKSVETTRRFYCGLEIDAAARSTNAILVAEQRRAKVVAQGAFKQKHRIRPQKGRAK